jgi:hypothetical protein
METAWASPSIRSADWHLGLVRLITKRETCLSPAEATKQEHPDGSATPFMANQGSRKGTICRVQGDSQLPDKMQVAPGERVTYIFQILALLMLIGLL